MYFVVTGCGRSGTNYIAERLKTSGLRCGHEEVFSVWGPKTDNNNLDGDSSWFAAPFIGTFNNHLKVVHIVRDPLSVINSFHRIGLCAKTPYRQFTMSQGFISMIYRHRFNLRYIKSRWNYVKAHRNLLNVFTSCMIQSSEFYRLCEYWVQWNKIIEYNVEKHNIPYFRVRLENLDDNLVELKKFLKIIRDIKEIEPTNKKEQYNVIKKYNDCLPENVIELSKRYGYAY